MTLTPTPISRLLVSMTLTPTPISRLLVSMTVTPTPLFKTVQRLTVLLSENVSFTQPKHAPVFYSFCESITLMLNISESKLTMQRLLS